jgi:hypothetical protein
MLGGRSGGEVRPMSMRYAPHFRPYFCGLRAGLLGSQAHLLMNALSSSLSVVCSPKSLASPARRASLRRRQKWQRNLTTTQGKSSSEVSSFGGSMGFMHQGRSPAVVLPPPKTRLE